MRKFEPGNVSSTHGVDAKLEDAADECIQAQGPS